MGQITPRRWRQRRFPPLTFQWTVHPIELWSWFGVSGGLAGRRVPPAKRFNYGTVIANSLLSYPRKSGDAVNEMTSLSNLTEELTLYVPTVPEPFPRGRFGWPFLQLKIFSLGSIVGRASPASFLGTPVAEGRSG
ncbi:Os02g0688100 [Oryza sativa Japonica Group]|uniref:Os02g0688100 protein n=1 Tax=Oryza sativa subsp. japonica TaxID=39947 RepID=A0A0P0VN46_ORYSJ|nr:Os02g0688100 [Oryza sativa Japonica Group]